MQERAGGGRRRRGAQGGRTGISSNRLDRRCWESKNSSHNNRVIYGIYGPFFPPTISRPNCLGACAIGHGPANLYDCQSQWNVSCASFLTLRMKHGLSMHSFISSFHRQVVAFNYHIVL